MASLADVSKRIAKGNAQAKANDEDIVAGLELVAETIQANAISKEDRLEDGKYKSRVIELLEVIAGGGGGGGSAPAVTPDDNGSVGNIGLLGGLLGAALGGLVGAVAGWAKAVKKVFEVLTPNKIAEPIGKFFTTVGDFFRGMGARMMAMWESVKAALSEGPIAKAIEGIKGIGARIAAFFAPLTEAISSMKGTGGGIAKLFEPITNGIARIRGFFSALGGSLSGFSKMFGAVFKIVGKIFYPLTLIMTAWDTVKGAMEGYAEDGFIGGILGGIEGLVNSLIMMPLDLIKSAVSWIAGFLGFENVEATLDSFSFEDMFSSVIDAIKEFLFAIPGYVVDGFTWLGEQAAALGDAIHENLIKPIADLFQEYVIDPLAELFAPIGEWFSSKMRMLMGFLEDFGIPAISFDIPVYGEVSIGPWYPFRNEGSDEGTTAIEAETTSSTQITSSSDGTVNESEQFRDYVRTTGSHIDMDGNYSDDITAVSVSDSSSVNGDYVANDAFLTFDTRTGISEYNGMEVDKDVYMAGKLAAMDGATTSEIELAMAREAAYNQLSWYNSAKALAGADPIELLSEQEGQSYSISDLVPGANSSGSVINDASVEVADGQRQGSGGGTQNNVVNAPTTVNNTTNQMGRAPVRNTDSTMDLAFAP